MRKPVTVWYGGSAPMIATRVGSSPISSSACPQGRGGGAAVIRFDPPAGKADLPGMVAQMVGALGEQERRTAGTVDQPDQHGGRRRLGAGPAGTFVPGTEPGPTAPGACHRASR